MYKNIYKKIDIVYNPIINFQQRKGADDAIYAALLRSRIINVYLGTCAGYGSLKLYYKVMEIQIGGQIHDEKNSHCTVCNEWKKFTGRT